MGHLHCLLIRAPEGNIDFGHGKILGQSIVNSNALRDGIHLVLWWEKKTKTKQNKTDSNQFSQ